VSDPFEELRIKNEKLEQIFSEIETQTIHGLVQKNRIGKVTLLKSNEHLSFCLDAYKIEDEITIYEEQALVTKPLHNNEEYEDLCSNVKYSEAISFKGKICQENPFNQTRIQLIEFYGPYNEKDFEKTKSKLECSIIIHDDILGRLTFDHVYKHFSGCILSNGERIGLRLRTVKPELSHNLQYAKEIIRNLDQYIQKASQFAADKLLKIFNQSWLDEGEQPISREKFIMFLTIKNLDFFPDQNYELIFDDNGLFLGHEVIVSASFESGFKDAYI